MCIVWNSLKRLSRRIKGPEPWLLPAALLFGPDLRDVAVQFMAIGCGCLGDRNAF
jgi:hypothetical protein